MRVREFHIQDFPEEVRILLKKDFFKSYLFKCLKKFGSKKNLANFLEVNSSTINCWMRKDAFIPLRIIKKTIKFTDISWKRLESKILLYKGLSTSDPIKNPVLPIKESPELFELITHLICDGCVVKSSGRPIYINSSKDLHRHFRELLRKSFGIVHGDKPNNMEYRFSKIIPDLIKHFYDVKFGSTEAYLPKEVFGLHEIFGCKVISAVVEDEGNISENRITINLKNRRLLNQIRRLLEKIIGNGHVTKIRPKDDCWSLSIKSQGLKIFEGKVELAHPIKKSDLLYAIQKPSKKENLHEFPWDTKIRILKLLNTGKKTSKEMARILLINRSNIGHFLRELEKIKFVKLTKKEKYSFVWTITKHGQEFLQNWTITHKPVDINLPNWEEEFNLPNKPVRILLNDYARFKMFWMLERILSSQEKIGKVFGVHRNTVSFWKTGRSLMPLNDVDRILKFLSNNGIDMVNETKYNIEEIRHINGLYPVYRG